MTTSLAPVRDEHHELLPHIDQLRTTADRVGTMPRARLVADVQSSIDFLTRHLRPHAVVEEEVLYPEVARLMGSPIATDTMRRDHQRIASYSDELQNVMAEILTSREITRVTQNDLRRLLYGLHALITAHFAKEEDVYLPIVEARLDDRDAARLLESMATHHRRQEHPGDGRRDVAHEVLDALNAGAVLDRPGRPASEQRPVPSPAADSDAPAPG